MRDLAAAIDRVKNLRKQAEATPAEITAHVDKEPSRVVDDARSKLLNLRLREQELLVQFADDSPPLRQVRAEIRLADQFLRQLTTEFSGTVRQARNPALMAVEQELVRTDADRASMAARAATLREELGKLDGQIATVSKQDPGTLVARARRGHCARRGEADHDSAGAVPSARCVE